MYGAAFAPYAKSLDWPMEEWDDDLARMKEMNFSTIRIFVPWDRIESKEGVLDFSKQDYIMELAVKHDIGVLLNVGGVFKSLQGVYPPRWLVRNYSVTPPWKDPCIPAHHSGTKLSVCLDDPIYREKAFDFIGKVVRRYSEHPATLGWMLSNEPGISPCYCPHTLANFKIWLEKKYLGNLDELNRIWGSEFPLDYATWEEIKPPVGGAGLNTCRDWEEFTHFRLTEAMMITSKTVKENDPNNHPCTSNILHGYYSPSAHGIEQSLDITGYSHYAVAHQGEEDSTSFQKSLFCDSNRWFSSDENRRTLALEVEAGPNTFMITPEKRRFYNYLAIGHNAKAIICWNYRCRYSDHQVCDFNLMGWDGSFTPRSKQHAEMAKTFNDHAELMNNSFPEAEVGVFGCSGKLDLLMKATHHSDIVPCDTFGAITKSFYGAFKLLWDMNITSDGIDERHFGNIDNYKIILLPIVENMTPEIAEALKGYVANGGTLIAESPFAFKDENNFLHGTAPIYGLDEVFGAITRDREGKETASPLSYSDGSKGEVCVLWHPYEVSTGKVIAEYDDGRAAVVENSYGKGKAIVAGSEFFRQYYNNPDIANTAFLRRSVLDSGVKRNAEIFIDGEMVEGSGIEACRLVGKPGSIYILLNHNKNEVKFEMNVHGSDAACRWLDLETGNELDINKEITLIWQR